MPIAGTKGRFVLSAALPVIVLELSLLPLWLGSARSHDIWLPIAQIVLTGIILPLYLAILGSWSLLRGARAPFVLVVLIIAAMLAVVLDYSVWGLSSGALLSPDMDTLSIEKAVGLAAIVITLVPPLVVLLFRGIHRCRWGGT